MPNGHLLFSPQRSPTRNRSRKRQNIDDNGPAAASREKQICFYFLLPSASFFSLLLQTDFTACFQESVSKSSGLRRLSSPANFLFLPHSFHIMALPMIYQSFFFSFLSFSVSPQRAQSAQKQPANGQKEQTTREHGSRRRGSARGAVDDNAEQSLSSMGEQNKKPIQIARSPDNRRRGTLVQTNTQRHKRRERTRQNNGEAVKIRRERRESPRCETAVRSTRRPTHSLSPCCCSLPHLAQT